MALIKCNECGKEVSDSAGKCPHCGAKVRKPVGPAGWIVAILAMILIVKFSLTESSAPVTSKPPPDPVAEARFQATLIMAAAIKRSMREPESLVWEIIQANDDASVACFAYRARNGFGGMANEIAVYANKKISQEAKVWKKYCTKPMHDMMHVQYALK